MSQAEFAELFNLARPSVGAYEEGRSEPKIDTIIQIANYFRISIDVLLTRQLTISEIYSFDQLNRTLDKVHQNKDRKKQTIQEVAIIRNTQYLEYIVNKDKNDFLSQLEHIGIPRKGKQVLRVFEVKGSEMTYNQQGLLHGDFIAAEKHDGKNLNDLMGQVIVAVNKNDILIKRIKDVTDQVISLSSDDPNYEPVLIAPSDLLEVWKPIGAYSTSLNAPTNLEERMLKLERMLERFKDQT